MKTYILLTTLIITFMANANSKKFFEQEFKDRDGCFLISEIMTERIVDRYNFERCKRRFPPMSTFKIPFTVMAFDSGYFESVDQVIKWDGEDRGRKSVNRDQTPKTFLDYSVIWVSREIIHSLGKKKVQEYVSKMVFGNKKVSGDFNNFWLSSGSLKVSAVEQIKFLSNLWRERLPFKKQAINLTKKVTFVKEIGNFMVYGKTGTGCIDKGCMNKPGRQLGWYVGIIETKYRTYAFALNYSDKKTARGFGGPKSKKIVHRYIEEIGKDTL